VETVEEVGSALEIDKSWVFKVQTKLAGERATALIQKYCPRGAHREFRSSDS
jgi:hypothetical protein